MCVQTGWQRISERKQGLRAKVDRRLAEREGIAKMCVKADRRRLSEAAEETERCSRKLSKSPPEKKCAIGRSTFAS